MKLDVLGLFAACSYALDCVEGELEWVEKDRIADLPLWEGDHIFLRLLQEKEDFFSLKLVYQGEKLMQAVLNGEQEL